MAQRRARPVRVLYMDHVPRMSGAEQSLHDLVVGIGRGPVEPVVALPGDGPLASQLRGNGVLVRIVPMNKRLLETSRTTLRRSPLTAVARLGAFLAANWRIFRLIRDVRPDIVHTNTLKSHLIAALPCFVTRVPHVWHMRDILEAGWLRRALAFAARFSAVVIVPSRAVAEGFRGHKRVYRKLRLIPNGIHVDEFAQAATDRSLREMMDVTKTAPVIGIVGRIAPWKGQDVFLRSAAMLAQRYPKAHFAIVGAVLFPENDAPFEQDLYRMVGELGLEGRVSFLGWQPAPEAMAALDIFVHASAEPEPFGRTLVEAMAAGKPVVAAAGGAVREIVPPSAGFIVPPGRPELLADALDRLLADKKLRTRMGKAGAAIAQDFFPVERTVHSVAQLYRALAARAARKRGRMRSRMPKALRKRVAAERKAQPQAQPRPLVWPRENGSAPEQTPTRPARPSSRRPVVPHTPETRRPARPLPPLPEMDDEIDLDGDFEIDLDDSDGESRFIGRAEPRAPRPSRPSGRSGGPAVMDAPVKRTSALRKPQRTPVPAPTPAPTPTRAPAIPERFKFEAKPRYDVAKRAMDLFISLTVLIVGSPIWILIAIAIKLESPGCALFKGTVVGKDCKPFTYYKFRSMRIDEDDKAHRRFIERYVRENGGHEEEGEVIYKLMGDDRVTRVGAFIRKLSLDEIPQLINVVKGQMSIIGPRPPLVYEYEHYDARAKQRLRVLPGISGMQQVWFRHSASFEDKLALDFKYMAERSIMMDLKLILHSAKAVFRGH